MSAPDSKLPKDTSKKWTARLLDRVERIGNHLPDPVTLFAILGALVLGVSWLADAMALAAEHPGTGEEIQAVNLLTAASIRRILVEMPRTFTDFPPLGLVLVVMIGIGVAERTGLIEVLLRAFVRGVPDALVTAAVVVGGFLSSLAVDAGYVVLIPLGAVIFHALGRHPARAGGAPRIRSLSRTISNRTASRRR